MRSYTALLLLSTIWSTSIIASPNEIQQPQIIEINVEAFKAPIKYQVTLPKSYQSKAEKKYFVLFDLHPRSHGFISGMHDWLSHNGDWPWLETIIVTPADYHPEFAQTFNALVENPNDHSILNIIQDGILAKLDSDYRTNGFRIYSGFMGNAALGLFAMLHKPDMFNAYILSAPTLNGDFAGINSNAATLLKQSNLNNKFLYMTIGDHRYEASHIQAFEEFESQLNRVKPKGLQWIVERNNGNYYMSRPVVALINGVEQLFDDIHNDLPSDSEISQKGATAIVEHYARLSTQKYGFEVSAEGSLKALAKSKLASTPSEAIAIYTKTTELYPDSAWAFSALADAYIEIGDLNKAFEIQSIAVEKANKMSAWHQRKQNEKMQALMQLNKDKEKH